MQSSAKPRRAAFVPFGGLLIRPADAQRSRLVIAATDDLQRQRQPGRSKAVWQCQRAEVQSIDKAAEMRRCRYLVDLAERNGCRLSGRRQQSIDIAERCSKMAFRVIALLQRPQIISCRNASAGPDPRPHRIID